MRISDWSSDVCSSDLIGLEPLEIAGEQVLAEAVGHPVDEDGGGVPLIWPQDQALAFLAHVIGGVALAQHRQLGKADRKSVGEGKSVSVRVDLGGRRNLTKKKFTKFFTIQ